MEHESSLKESAIIILSSLNNNCSILQIPHQFLFEVTRPTSDQGRFTLIVIIWQYPMCGVGPSLVQCNGYGDDFTSHCSGGSRGGFRGLQPPKCLRPVDRRVALAYMHASRCK